MSIEPSASSGPTATPPSSGVDRPTDRVGASDAPILSSAIAGRGRRVMTGLVVAILLASIVREVAQQTQGARGPTASSYATSPGGLAALHTLLRQRGADVIQLTKPINEAYANSDFLAGDRLVVLDQSLSPAEVETLRSFLAVGGELLGGGRRSGRWIGELWNVGSGDQGEQVEDGEFDVAEVREGASGNVTTIGGTEPVRSLRTSGDPLVWRDLGGDFTPLVVDRDFRVVLARQGTFDAIADPSLLSNETLAESDNAVFALGLLATDQRVVFAEAGHGFRSGPGSGLSAVPSNVRTLLLGLLLAAFLWMLAVGRRVGGPDLPSRPLPPGRFAHVAAVASLLDRTARTSSVATAAPASPLLESKEP